MNFFRKLFRAAKVVAHFAYAMVELVVTRPHSRPERAAWLSRFTNRVLRSMDVTYSTSGPVPNEGAVITNHLSYVDIMVHSAMRPCVFVSKAELRKTPVLGWISMMSGTVYVQRGAGGSAAKAAEGMGKGFRDHLPVVFFPEGTTGVGDEAVMPFHSGLLAQAQAAGAPMYAGFIVYRLSPQDVEAGRTARNDIHWGPQSLVGHLWNFMGLHPVHCHVHFLAEPIPFTPAAQKDRKLAAVEARAAVLQASEQVPAAEVAAR